MKISTKGRYALRIMIDLARQPQDQVVPLKDISKRQGITLKYMEQIMPLLTKAGYVRGFRGNNGGYLLARDPKDYRIGDILRTVEGSLAPIACLDDEPNRCGRQEACPTLPFWEGLWQVINTYVDSVTLADLAEASKK